MNIVKISGINSVNSNQNRNKIPYDPSFGLFVLADSKAGSALARKMMESGRPSFAEKVVDLIEVCKGENIKGIIRTDGNSLVEAYDERGKQIYQTRNVRFLDSLFIALNSVIGKNLPREIPKTSETVISRLVGIIKDCPIVESLQDLKKLLAKQGSNDFDPNMHFHVVGQTTGSARA